MLSSANRRSTPRPYHVALGRVLLACASGLEVSRAAQANALAVRFSPDAGTFVGSEIVTLSVRAEADIHYTLDGSRPTASSPLSKAP